ncbi:MAG: MFS transporter [Clostridiales Family XIII bacterium]|jgi:MFS family permease|nr:MFS transporter [Clostridiales Family XIII bacterium]
MNPYQANSPGRKMRTVWTVYLGMITMIIDSTGGSVILPVAAEEIGGADIWPMSMSISSILGIAIMPLFGYLCAKKPHLKYPLLLASLASAVVIVFLRVLATSMWGVIIPNLFYGFASGAIFCIGYMLIRDMYDRKKAGTLLGFVALMQGVGLLAGPLFTGIVVDTIGWRFMYVIIGALYVLVTILSATGARVTKEDGASLAVIKGSFDYAGAVSVMTFLAGLVCMLSMINYMPWGSVPNLILIGIVVVSLISLITVIRRKGTEAFIPIPVLKDRNTLMLFAINTCFTFSAMGPSVFLPTYMLYVMGKTPTEAGVASAMYAVAGIILGPVFGKYIASTGTARETVMYFGGLLRLAVQLSLFFFLLPDSPIWVVYIIMGVGGIYSVVGGVTPAVAPQIQLREEIRPLGNSIIQLGGTLGSTVGICIFTAIVATLGPDAGFKTLLIVTSTISVMDFIFALPLKKLEGDDLKKAESSGT